MGVGIETGDIHWTSQGDGTGACKQSDNRVAGKVRSDCQRAIIIFKGALPCHEKRTRTMFQPGRFIPFADRDENHVHWAHGFIRLLTELQSYVRKYHAAGLVWNPKVTTALGKKRVGEHRTTQNTNPRYPIDIMSFLSFSIVGF